MERFTADPTPSVPKACQGWGETTAYRFFDNDSIDWRAIMAPHWEQTEQRMAAQPVVLCLQDTTELDFNGQGAFGLGPLSYEAQRGMYLHPTYAVTPGREPLGIVDAWMWAREKKDKSGIRGGPKESLRWVEGYERIAEMAAHLPDTRLVYVADREADLIPLMLRAEELGTPADWLVRAAHNRCLPDGEKLWQHTGSGERSEKTRLRWRHDMASKRARCASNCGYAESNFRQAKARPSAPPASLGAKSMRHLAPSRLNGACSPAAKPARWRRRSN
jgi:hypothetical protein